MDAHYRGYAGLMAKKGGGASKGGPARSTRTPRTAKGNTGAGAKPTRKKVQKPAPAPVAPPEPRGPFRLGAIEGATPGKWIDLWHERMPRVVLELVPLSMTDQRDAVLSATVDAAIVRLPPGRTAWDARGLHTIALYDELPVVICAADSHLTAADELTLDDLAGEVVITALTAPYTVEVAGAVAARFEPPHTVSEAIATIAAGVGVTIVPLSLARLHHRKDIAHRPLVGGPVSPVALVWPEEATTPLVEAFVGIVRGRTANSSR